MLALMWQTALLLLAAYFLGAWIACMVRRIFFADSVAESYPRSEPAAVPAAASRAPAPPPSRRPDPAPIAPRIETIDRPAEPAARFGRALAGEQGGTAAPSTPAAPVAPRPISASPAPAPKPPAAAPAPPPDTQPMAVQPVPAAMSSSSSSSAATASAIAAAAASAAAAAARAKPVAPPSAPVPQPFAPSTLPAAASSSGGPSSVAAPVASPAAAVAPAALPPAAPVAKADVAPAASPPAAPVAKADVTPADDGKPDDLTLIRAIDPELSGRLAALGVRRFASIAAWKPADVARVSQALGFKGRIEHENWIEQAQVLAGGGETFYSRRKLRGELVTSAPTTDEGEKRTITPVTPAAPAAPSAAAQTAAATAAAAAAAAVRTAAATSAAPAAVAPPPPPPPRPVAAPAPAAPAAPPAPPPRVEERAAFANPPAAATVGEPTPPAPRPAVIGARDGLQRIGGINAEVEKLLNVQGVTKYSQIAGWTPGEVARFDRLLGFEGRIARENWIEQAQILSRNGETAHSREFDRRSTEAKGDSTRPARLADAIRDTATKPATPDAPPASDGPRQRTDLSALRSVRSEAYRGSEGMAVPPASGPMLGASAAGPAAGRARGDGADDLKRIRGIGVLIEKKLNALGITTYDQVANWTSSEIDRISQTLDFKGRIERENWVEQARILASGGHTEFSRRVDRGELDSSRSKPE